MNSSKEKLRRELTKLWTGELAAVISFWVCFFVIKKWLIGTLALLSVICPLCILSFILIQGSVYWWILLKRLTMPDFAKGRVGNIYRFLKVIDVFLLCLGLVAIPIYNNIATVLIGIPIWMFALIEWINYYKIRLSYSYNPTILLRHVKNGTLKKSRLAREIEKR